MNDAFLDRLSQPRPDPGGGAAAAHGGLLGLAIMEKIARLEAARPKQGNREDTWTELLHHIRMLTKEFRVLQDRDSDAYMKLTDARSSKAGNTRALEQAWEEAILCPMAIMEVSVAALKVLSEIGNFSGKHLVADLQVALEFLGASFRGACHIARSNVSLLARDRIEDRYSARLSELLWHAEDKLGTVKEQLRQRSDCVKP